jgi:hypothetical protein
LDYLIVVAQDKQRRRRSATLTAEGRIGYIPTARLAVHPLPPIPSEDSPLHVGIYARRRHAFRMIGITDDRGSLLLWVGVEAIHGSVDTQFDDGQHRVRGAIAALGNDRLFIGIESAEDVIS